MPFKAGSLLVLAGLCVVTVLFMACAQNRITTFPTLANKGILALSTSNAFLGSNLFLAREIGKSSYLFRFFEAKGAPIAIEILESQVNRPQLLLFYPREREVYVADLTGEPERRQWIVRGPYQIGREDYRSINRMQLALTGEPVFDIYIKSAAKKGLPGRDYVNFLKEAVKK